MFFYVVATRLRSRRARQKRPKHAFLPKSRVVLTLKYVAMDFVCLSHLMIAIEHGTSPGTGTAETSYTTKRLVTPHAHPAGASRRDIQVGARRREA